MPDRYPGYDVMAKQHSLSWNEQTRRVVNARLAVPREPRFFTSDEFRTVSAIAARIVPQEPPAAIPVAALVDARLHDGRGDGYRHAGMPRAQEAWRRGLQALDAEAQGAFGSDFHALPPERQDRLLQQMQDGELCHAAWDPMTSEQFFKQRMAHDIVLACYSHPTSWSRIGCGGPASPRGYVRVGYDERDPWEAAEVKNGDAEAARRANARAV